MSVKAIREQIAAIVAGISGVGVVHEYERWTATWKDFIDLFQDDGGKINGWMIRRIRTVEEDWGGSGQYLRHHSFRLTGIYGLQDAIASEITFQDDIVEPVCSALREERQLNDTADNSQPPQVKTIEERLFGNVLCHYCEIELVADEIEVVSL